MRKIFSISHTSPKILSLRSFVLEVALSISSKHIWRNIRFCKLPWKHSFSFLDFNKFKSRSLKASIPAISSLYSGRLTNILAQEMSNTHFGLFFAETSFMRCTKWVRIFRTTVSGLSDDTFTLLSDTSSEIHVSSLKSVKLKINKLWNFFVLKLILVSKNKLSADKIIKYRILKWENIISNSRIILLYVHI